MATEPIPPRPSDDRVPILYLAPWVDVGGSDKSTVDWFRFLDRDRFRASLITTQPSANRRLHELGPYAEELWELPELISGDEFSRFILSFIHTRAIRVVQIMNSNLGFELLPDIAALPRRPRVVVQFHTEERDGSGYIGYATPRFGNLVDAFSLVTHALSTRLEELEVPAAKRRVIPIGVDSENEFNPSRVAPVPDLDPELFHILFPARLVEQKDPLLMVGVAAELRKAGVGFQLHVVGDGELANAVRAEIAAAGLGREVIAHGDCLDVAPWYASCHAVLLTSRWEGLPAVAYEGMAMGLPIVAPDLPGMDELISRDSGVLVAPRDDPAVYAEALGMLAADPVRRAQIGTRAREEVRSRFPPERMAAQHASLYEELISGGPGPPEPPTSPPHPQPRPAGTVRLARREPRSTPLVSVIVPCFNHGRYLPACLESIAAQTYPSIEVVVVDDGSTDPETLTALSELEREGPQIVVWLPTNRGPSAARNAGVERSSGRYILQLDADNLLVPTAVAALVEQLNAADEDVGFVYPNLQYFGNRTDYEEMPSYNLHALLGANQCDAGSLIDREVFDRGLRYPEDMVLGHEDWDFALTLAERGIYGEPARSKTLLCRRHGFSRNDLVEVSGPFAEAIEARHPELYTRKAEIKGEWNPALTIIALDPQPNGAEATSELVRSALGQTCPDFELLVRSGREPEASPLGRRLRSVASEPGATRAIALAGCVEASRGRYALATYGSAAELLADSALVEKVLRVIGANPRLTAIALAESGMELAPFRLLDSEKVGHARIRAICWTTTGPDAPPASHPLPPARPLEALARWLSACGTIQFRHLAPGDARPAEDRGAAGSEAALGTPRIPRRADARFRDAPPQLPECPRGVPYRVAALGTWMPPQTRLLCRHVDRGSGRYAYTNDPHPPAGFAHDRILGCLREYPLPGTTSVRRGRDGVLKFGCAQDTLDDPDLLGFAERDPLPLFDELYWGSDATTDRQLLVAGEDDPLAGALKRGTVVGYLVPHPLRPCAPEHIDTGYGLAGLLRSVDVPARRHRYGVRRMPAGAPAGELGAMFTEPTGDCDPIWVDEEGRVFTEPDRLVNGRPSLRDAVRWIGDPLTWDRFGPSGPKLRASARRALDSVLIMASPPPKAHHGSDPAGYLLRSPTGCTVPLHGALHPVTGDQLLTTNPSEIAGLGYRRAALLGYLAARAPVTGRLGPVRPAAPWAARFGLLALGEPQREGE